MPRTIPPWETPDVYFSEDGVKGPKGDRGVNTGVNMCDYCISQQKDVCTKHRVTWCQRSSCTAERAYRCVKTAGGGGWICTECDKPKAGEARKWCTWNNHWALRATIIEYRMLNYDVHCWRLILWFNEKGYPSVLPTVLPPNKVMFSPVVWNLYQEWMHGLFLCVPLTMDQRRERQPDTLLGTLFAAALQDSKSPTHVFCAVECPGPQAHDITGRPLQADYMDNFLLSSSLHATDLPSQAVSRVPSEGPGSPAMVLNVAPSSLRGGELLPQGSFAADAAWMLPDADMEL